MTGIFCGIASIARGPACIGKAWAESANETPIKTAMHCIQRVMHLTM